VIVPSLAAKIPVNGIENTAKNIAKACPFAVTGVTRPYPCKKMKVSIKQ